MKFLFTPSHPLRSLYIYIYMNMNFLMSWLAGCEPLIQLYEILLRTPGVLGARFSGAGFRGCCLAFVEADEAVQAASFVRNEYLKLQPLLASQLNKKTAVLICEAGDCACVIWLNVFIARVLSTPTQVGQPAQPRQPYWSGVHTCILIRCVIVNYHLFFHTHGI